MKRKSGFGGIFAFRENCDKTDKHDCRNTKMQWYYH
jgi:hypothetical protein